MARMSIATIDKPEFINVTPKNPLISECEIKVLYLGENRNHSYITKEVATEMANTLPGCPIVGYYKDDKQDFADHGDRVIFDDEGIHFKCMTVPYGFVAPNAKVWFQKFEDTDEFGNTVVREYLMTTGFLWTGQYEECQRVVDRGNPHSMELDKDTLDGYWTKNQKTGMDFFIINDAIFSKLCILGEDVEPCFEGSSVTAPNVSASFTKVDDNFKKTLFSMMQELKFALEGGQQEMIIDQSVEFTEDKSVEESTTENQFSVEESVQNSFAASEEKKEEEKKEDEEDKFAKADDEDPEDEDKKEDEEEDKFAKADEDDDEDDKEENKNEDDDKEDKYALLQSEFEALQTSYSELESKYQALVTFKNQIEDEKKDELINSFYMLSEEDKKEVIEHKSSYSLDEIESKLSVICFRKKVNFDLDNTSEIKDRTESSPVTTFNLEEQAPAVPAMVAALRNTQKNRNI